MNGPISPKDRLDPQAGSASAADRRTARRLRLRALQNPDGGWPYLAGKNSWSEPTLYVLLALEGDPDSVPACARGREFIHSLQRPDGALRPTPRVADGHWSTSLAVTLACSRRNWDEPAKRALDWMLHHKGTEGRLTTRIQHWLFPKVIEQDHSIQGWPFFPETASWVEPTVHALIALRQARQYAPSPLLDDRVAIGERVLLDRRCNDGGWNFGNRRVLGEDLVGYPETTALGLLGLQGRDPRVLQPSRQLVQRFFDETRSDLAQAWLTLAMRAHHLPLPDGDPPESAAETRDPMLTALRLLGSGPDRWRVLSVPEDRRA